MGTDEQEQIVKDLLYDIDRMERESGCHQAKLQQMIQQLRQVADAIEAETLGDFDAEKGQLLMRVTSGVNEVRAIAYPTPQQIWAAVQEATELTKALAQKRKALARCRGSQH